MIKESLQVLAIAKKMTEVITAGVIEENSKRVKHEKEMLKLLARKQR